MRKLKLFVLLLITGLYAVQLTAQDNVSSLDEPLPIDEKVKIGTLENGMKYYIRENEKPENRVELTLVVNAGAVLEDDDQQGFAHMLEHMAFNGTKNFEKHEVINFLESIGMKFGPEVNAYTSFDETVYGIKVPLDEEAFLDTGLLVLFDWASGIALESEEIDKERGVIEEEWRMGQGAQDRMMRQYLPVMLHESQYAKRLPIGKMEIIREGSHEALRRFYNDWYRPDLMAIIAVGDIDVAKIEKKIIAQFSQIPSKAEPRERVYFDVPDHEDTKVVVAKDKEAQMTLVQLYHKHPAHTMGTHGEYRQSIIHQLYNQMLSNRLQELTMQAEPPFLMAQSGYGGFIGPKDAYTSVAVTQGNQIRSSIENLVIENERVKMFGFTKTELEREKKSLLRSIEKMFNEKDKAKSDNFVREYTRNFLKPHDPIPGIEYEYELYKKYMPTIELEELNVLAEKWITNENRVLVLMGPEKEGVELPNEDEILSILENVSLENLEPYKDKTTDKELMAKLPAPGKVDKKKKNKKLGYETWTLENGIKVVVKPTNFKEDEILFRAFSAGGWSNYGLKDDVSASIAADIMSESGIGDFSKLELEKYLSDKMVRVNPYLSELSEGLSGSTSPQDIETFMQLVHLHFTKPRKDQEAYESYINKMRGYLENQGASPENAFRDSIGVIMSNNHPRKKPLTAERLSEADFKRVTYIYRQRFADPSNFTFVFVGNIDTKTFKPFVEQYIGSLPVVRRDENWKNIGVETPSGRINSVVHKGTEPKSIVYLNYHGKFEYSWEDRMDIDMVCKILSTKLLESIREEESGVYSIGAYPRTSHYPNPEFEIVISFGCNPDNVDKLIAGVDAEITGLMKKGPSDEELSKAIQKKLRERESAKEENRYWLNRLYSNIWHGDDPAQYFEYNDYVEGMTIEHIRTAAAKFFGHDNRVQVVLKPE